MLFRSLGKTSAHFARQGVRSVLVRPFRATASIRADDAGPTGPPEYVSVIFVDGDNNRIQAKAQVGKSILAAAWANEVPIPGNCGGGGASLEDFGEGPCCNGCHVMIANEWLKVADKMEYKEKDWLWKTENSNKNSRLGCQVEITKEMEGMIVAVPEYGEPFVDLPFTQ